MHYSINPPVWNVVLTHAEVGDANRAAELAAAGAPGPVTAAIAAALEYVEVVDWIGGNNGVSIIGTVGQPGPVMVVPAAVPIYAGLLAVIAQAPPGVPALIGAVVLHCPALGLLGVLQLLPHIPHPFGASSGEVRGDQDDLGDHETMAIIGNGDGTVSFITACAYLSLDDDPTHDHQNLGNTVHGAGRAISNAEKWIIERHPLYPQAVAIKSVKNNLYMICWKNHGDRLSVEAHQPGIDSAYVLDFFGQGQCALRVPQVIDFSRTKYVSVVP
jgi:hypothetical protein